jgi:hypothetical protein
LLDNIYICAIFLTENPHNLEGSEMPLVTLVLVLGRNPTEVGAAERQAVACAVRTRVEWLDFVRIDSHNPKWHRDAVLLHEPGRVCVLLENERQAPMVATAAAEGVLHLLFGNDTSADGSRLGNRLFWYTPDGTFQLCRRSNKT